MTSKPDIRLRPFVAADDESVSSWFADAGELRFFAGRRLRWPPDTAQWDDIRADPSVSAWTGTLGDGDTPVGHAELVAESADSVLLDRIAIDPAYRGQGFGRAMLPQLYERARESGAKVLMVAVHPDNANAILAYRTFGFEQSDDRDPVGRVLLRLDLGKRRVAGSEEPPAGDKL